MYLNKLRGVFRISRTFYNIVKYDPKCATSCAKKTTLTKYSVNSFLRYSSNYSANKYSQRESGLVTSNELISSIERRFRDRGIISFNNFSKLVEIIRRDPSLTTMFQDEQILFLLNACGDLMPAQLPKDRMMIFNNLWRALTESYKLEIGHYLAALNIYRQNACSVEEFLDFLSQNQLQCNEWPKEMYEGIVYLACAKGNVEKATEIIEKMRNNNVSLTENVYNALILGHSRNNDIANLEEVIKKMKSENIPMTSSTYTELIRAFIELDQKKNAVNLLEAHTKEFQSGQIVSLLRSAVKSKNYDLLPSLINELPQAIFNSNNVPNLLRNHCIELVFESRFEELVALLGALPNPHFNIDQDTDTYGIFIIKELFRNQCPDNEIIKICSHLVKSEKNTRALHYACEYVIRQMSDQISPYFQALSKFEKLRPHYFWPLLIKAFSKEGEAGILRTLKEMISYNVDCDTDTIMIYVLPKLFTTLEDPKQAMKTLTDCGLKSSQILTPILCQMIYQQKITEAIHLIQLYEHKYDTNEFIKPLADLAVNVSSPKLLSQYTKLLQKLSTKAKDPNVDFVGHVLLEIAEKQNLQNDLFAFIKEVWKNGMKISPVAKETLSIYVNASKDAPETKSMLTTLNEMSNPGLSFSKDLMHGPPTNKHPNDMTLEELECHLIELETKGLNSRGVLRKILQMYVRVGQLDKALETKKKCDKLKVNISPGMLASILEMYIKLKDPQNAEIILKNLKKTYPAFLIDEHKIIDYATLLVENNQLEKAMKTLTDRAKSAKVLGGENVVKNIWSFLTSVANLASRQKDLPKEANTTKDTFNLLCTLRFCSPQNTLLGPIVREYILRNDIVSAVEEFKAIADKHRHTPLQYELLSLLVHMSNGHNLDKFKITTDKAKELLNEVVAAVSKIHGVTNMNSSLLLAIAESGTEAQVRKLLINPNFRINQEMLLKNCTHLSEEGSLTTLMKLARASRDFGKVVNEQGIYNEILKNFIASNNYESAMKLFHQLEADDEFQISQEFSRKLLNLLKVNNLDVPTSVALRAQVM